MEIFQELPKHTFLAWSTVEVCLTVISPHFTYEQSTFSSGSRLLFERLSRNVTYHMRFLAINSAIFVEVILK